jgi:hypothetical protein
MAEGHPQGPLRSRTTHLVVATLGLALAGCGSSPTTSNPPLLNRPALLEDQQAMPELRGFDATTPPATPGLGAPLGTPSAPPLGPGALLGQ